MKYKGKTTERGIRNVMISFLTAMMLSILLFLTGHACSAQAQSVVSDYRVEHHPVNQAKNDNKD